MEGISTAGWVAIIVLAVLLLTTNLSLIAIARRKKTSPPAFIKSLNLIKNPWEDEDQQWHRLNAAVKHLDETDIADSQDS
jgi:hypothetical protein